MGEELLSLRWNNHQSHFVDILTFLREQEVFIDVTLACGGKLYPAHKFVLSTCSDYFKQMFTKIPDKHPIVFMKDVLCKDLEALLDFMYHGEVNVPQSSLGSLIKTAEGLQIKGLAVPDDPPVPKKDANVKERRDLKARDNSYSPSPKRLRTREKSPSSVSNNNVTNRRVADKNRTGDVQTSELGEEDSQNSGVGDSISSVNAKSNLNSQYSQDASPVDNLNPSHSNDPSPGPSGLQPSKEEQLEIKQEEEIVDLEDESGWSGLDSDGREQGLVDGMMGSLGVDGAPNFSDLLVPPSDSSLNNSSTGDPAMMTAGSLAFLRHPFLQSGTAASTPTNSYFCKVCGRSFNNFYRFQIHAKYHERVQRSDNICPVCGRKSQSRSLLMVHIRTHTGERPHACSLCSYRASDPSNLTKHIRKKHPDS